MLLKSYHKIEKIGLMKLIQLLFFLILNIQLFSSSQFKDWTPINQKLPELVELKVADFNGDGNQDILIINNLEIYFSLSLGDRFDKLQFVGRLNTTHNNLILKDVNCDGMDDLITIDNKINVRFADRVDENGILTDKYSFSDEVSLYDFETNRSRSLMTVCDFTFDCMADFLLFDPVTKYFDLYITVHNNNTQSFSVEKFSNSYQFENEKIISLNSGNLLFEDGVDTGRNELVTHSINDSIVQLSVQEIELDEKKFTFNFSPLFQMPGFYEKTKLKLSDFNGDSHLEIFYKALSNSDTTIYSLIKLSDNAEIVKINQKLKIVSTDHPSPVCGDFNGDGFSDFCYLSNNKLLVMVTESLKKKVGTFFTLWYHQQNGSWDNNRVDKKKMPATGWSEKGIKESVAPYSSQDIPTIISQLKTMEEVGVDFVVADMSNGWPPKTNPSLKGLIPTPYTNKKKEYHGDQSSTNAAMKFEQAIKEVPDLKYAFMIGLEFQGPERFFEKDRNWEHKWSEQYERIDEVTRRIRKIVKANKSQYFYYLGKPLLIVYLSKGYDFPPREYSNSNKTIPRWDYLLQDFTIRYSTGVLGTFDNQARNDRSDKNYREGKESKNFWTWGAGRYDNDYRKPGNDNLPYDKECMTVMPGQNFVNKQKPFEAIKRRKGNYFRNTWSQVIDEDPNVVLLTDWNNWSEETAIEKCYNCGENWQDDRGNDIPDYYLQLTQQYVSYYKSGELLLDSFIIDNKNGMIYHYNGNTMREVEKLPELAVPIFLSNSQINKIINK